MRTLVCYCAGLPKLAAIAADIGKGLEANGHRVELFEVASESKPMSMVAYDLVVFGSPSLGFLGGKIPEEMTAFIGKCSRLEGRKAAAFVVAGGLGTAKSLGVLMKAVEKQGGILMDSATLSGGKDANEFGKRLKA